MAKAPNAHRRKANERDLEIVYRRVSSLLPNEYNPRLHSRRQIAQIEKSIETFGFVVPVLVKRDLEVVAGHGRLLAAQNLGIARVPTIALEHLSRRQAQAFMIADNRLVETSAWDERLLGETLKELCALDLEFSIEATGFTTAEIDSRIEALDAGSKSAVDPADKLPKPPQKAVTKPGDLWLLGSHRLLCGNALASKDYEALMNGAQAAMVFTDPPYNVRIDGHVSGLGAKRHREFAMASGEMTAEQFTHFLSETCEHLSHNSLPGSLHYICMDWRHLSELLAAGTAAYSELKNLCVWAKDNAGMGSLYRSQHELVLVFKHGNAKHRNNVELGRFGRNRSNVWQYPGVNSFARLGMEGDLSSLHPTVKPVALVADATKDASARGDIVLDPFLGSGTSLIACERTGRRCYALEIDPVYVDVAIKRWEALTGKTARLAASEKRLSQRGGKGR